MQTQTEADFSLNVVAIRIILTVRKDFTTLEPLYEEGVCQGGTAAAAANLVAKAGGRVVESVFFIELGFLDGRAKMGDVPVRALVKY